MEWGDYSWPKTVELFPVYAGVLLTVILLLITINQVKEGRSDAASRAAFEFFSSVSKDAEHIKLRNEYIRIRGQFSDLGQLQRDGVEANDLKSLLTLTNWYELLCAGIQNGGISDEFAFDYWRATLIRDFLYLADYIQALQEFENNKRIGRQFALVTIRWIKKSEELGLEVPCL